MYKSIFTVMLVLGVVFAGGGNLGGNVQNALTDVQNFLCNVLPTVLFVAIVFAALLYGVAQMLPADQKARVMQFAGAALVAAVLGAIIYVIAPSILGTLIGNTFSC